MLKQISTQSVCDKIKITHVADCTAKHCEIALLRNGGVRILLKQNLLAFTLTK